MNKKKILETPILSLFIEGLNISSKIVKRILINLELYLQFSVSSELFKKKSTTN